MANAQRPMRDLLIAGDIHGFPGADDLSNVDWLPDDIIRLADFSGRPDLNGEGLHEHLFNGGGMEHAVRRVCEIGARPCVGVGFSAGGTLLWNAVRQGLRLQALICISSTRLRLETAPLALPTMTLWGGLDPHRPVDSWNAVVPAFWKTYPDQPHDFYKGQIGDSCSPLRRDLSAFFVALQQNGCS